LDSPWIIVQPRQGYFARRDALGFVSNNLLEKFEAVVLDGPHSCLILVAKGFLSR
jgi:hypothetical protein